MTIRCIHLLVLLFAFFKVDAQSFDLRLLQIINGPASSADQSWVNVSKTVGVISLLTPATMLTVGLASHDKELTVKAFETGGAVIIAEGLTLGMKRLVKRERPYTAYPDLIFEKGSASYYSFPSGHTSVAFATATSLSLAFPKWYVIVPAFTYASAVGYSRLYLGVHYPTDVLAGAATGAASAFISWELQKLLNKKYHYH